MKLPARFVFVFAFALCTACAQWQPDTQLPARYDLHNPESNAALWGAGD